MLLIISILLTALVVISVYFIRTKRSAMLVEMELVSVQKKNQFMLKARDTLLRSVNQELRAPLTRMKLDLEFLSESEEKESLKKTIGYMQELVEELMKIEKVSLDTAEL